MAQARRSGSRNSLIGDKNMNRSNSNIPSSKRTSSAELQKQDVRKQISSPSLKILGQDGEVSEDMIWDRSTPVSSRSQQSDRPISSRRTPTPSKQISLQAVKRKQESFELLEPIDWNDIDQPVKNDESVPRLPVSDADSDPPSPVDNPMSPEERLALVEERTRQMTSALSTARMDDSETDLAKRLELIETAREEREKKELKEREKRELEEKEKRGLEDEKLTGRLTVEDGRFTYRNEHFRDLSKRDQRDKIDSDFILEGEGAYYNKSVTVGSQQKPKLRGENTIGRHPMDKPQETVVNSEVQQQNKSENEKNDEASADAESSNEEESEEEEEDLIGEKGKAPNALLMEFLSSMMEEDYETAEKLCKMILIYEPDNQEALSFYPLIQEKIKQEEEEGDDDDEDDSDDDSDDSGEEEDSNDDDDDDDDDDDNESSDESEDDTGMGNQLDSGVASANSD